MNWHRPTKSLTNTASKLDRIQTVTCIACRKRPCAPHSLNCTKCYKFNASIGNGKNEPES